MRVILIVESPLSARDAWRFGLDILASSGLSPQVWEVGPIFLPRSELQWRAEPEGYTIRRFVSMSELVTAASGCSASDAIITLVGTQQGQLRRYRDLLRAISLSPARLGTVSAAPVVEVEPDRATLGLSARARSLWSRALRRPGIPRRATQAFVLRRYGIRPMGIVWIATTSVLIEPLLLDEHTRIVPIHSYDYDLVLRYRKSEEVDSGPILMLDTMGPDHPDYVTHGENPWTLSSDAYFEMLADRLNQIETASGATIEIAAHPRARPGSLDERYAGRIVHYGRTAEAISQSRMVLLTNASTAVGLAVAMDKPIMMIRESRFPASELRRNDRLVSWLGLAQWTSTSPSEPWAWPLIETPRYAAYLSEFVKLAGTPQQPFWEVVVASLTTTGVQAPGV